MALAGKTVKVANSYFDEALEMSDTEESASQSYRQTEREPPRGGDSPPSAKLSVSDDDYEEGDGEGEDEEYNEEHRAEDEAFEETIKKGRGGAAPISSSATKNVPIGTQGIPNTTKFMPPPAKTGGLREEEETHADGDSAEDRFGGAGLKEEIKQLLEYISRYSPQEQDLEAELKPFILDLIPAIGDIDAFIKVQRVDQKPDMLGLALLDEPSTVQSDPSVLDLHLRALNKSSAVVPQVVRSIDSTNLRTDPRQTDNWIKSIKELHGKKPPPSVNYSRRMPDIEELMQVWPPEVEAEFESSQLPICDIDLPLQKYCALIALILDIPVAPASTATDAKSGTNPIGAKMTAPKPTNIANNHTIEALHVIFTLYSEFKNSVHFKAMGRTRKSVSGPTSS